MTVIGSLEDLSFPDILQVVHVSRQSGTLVLTAPDGERRIRFQNGLVCGATLGQNGPELEELLLERGLVGEAALAAARERNRGTGKPLPGVLVSMGAVPQEAIEGLVREELRSLLRSLVLLQEGEFRFEVQRGDTATEAGDLGVRDGLLPETILRDLPRGGRSARRRSAARAGAPRTVLLLERSALCRLVRGALERAGFEVETCDSAHQALEAVRTLSAGGAVPSVAADLILPDARGGVLGGLDLAERLKRIAPAVTVVLVGEPGRPEIAAAARRVGASAYLPLPDLQAGRAAEVAGRLETFAGEVVRALSDPGSLPVESSGTAPAAVRAVDPLSLLRGLIGELRDDGESGIPLLVLRLAAEYFERGVLFSVRGSQACGAGAFGSRPGAPAPEDLELRLRGAVLPLQRGSLLQRAVQERAAYVGPVTATRSNAPLLEKLGGPVPAEAALLPLLSGRHVFGILYGDNARTGRPLGDLKALEIFLSQAGMALENALLQRRIATLASGEGAPPAGAGTVSHA